MRSLSKISHEDLKEKLRLGSVRFYFRKVSGELRIALGTLNLQHIPTLQHPKGGKAPNNCTVYYDLEKNLWRSISKTQEIWIDQID